MSDHKTHDGHAHVHGAGCGHKTVEHDGHVDEHQLAIGGSNPADCTPSHACGGHDAAHKHGPDCGHDAIAHGDHTDYIVAGHLHHAHDGHCDDHGKVTVA